MDPSLGKACYYFGSTGEIREGRVNVNTRGTVHL